MDATLAALLGAVIGGLLSVLASWLAQRIQARGQWLAQEIRRRQDLYGEFLDTAVRGYADALLRQEPDGAMLAKLYAEMGRMRLHSSPEVIHEGLVISHRILEAYADPDRTILEIRDLLAHDSLKLFEAFGDACRAELDALRLKHL